MTRTSRSLGVAGLVLGVVTVSVNCGSHPSDPPAPQGMGIPLCLEGAASTSEGELSTLVVSSAGRGASGIALDERNVYLESAWGVFFAPKGGGTLAPFAGAAPAFHRADSATDGAFEYRREGNAVVRASAEGTSVVVESSQEHVSDECFAIALRLGSLYWTGADGVLRGAPVQAGQPSVLDRAGGSDCDDDYEGLAVVADDTGIYWIAGTPGERTSDDQPLTLYRTCRSNTPATN